jgi:hypothetical protein
MLEEEDEEEDEETGAAPRSISARGPLCVQHNTTRIPAKQFNLFRVLSHCCLLQASVGA